MTESWRQVVDSDPAAMRPSDVANLGPPPRELTPGHLDYVARAKPSLAGVWTVLAVLSLGSFAILFAVVGFQAAMVPHLWFPALLIALAVWSRRKAAAQRAILRRVLAEGELRLAVLENCIQTPVGRGLAKRYRYHARFNVDGSRLMLVTMNDGLALLQPGTRVEVVWHPQLPGEIIPTFLLA